MKLKVKTEQVNEIFVEFNSLKAAKKEAYAKQLKQFAQSRQKSTLLCLFKIVSTTISVHA